MSYPDLQILVLALMKREYYQSKLLPIQDKVKFLCKDNGYLTLQYIYIVRIVQKGAKCIFTHFEISGFKCCVKCEKSAIALSRLTYIYESSYTDTLFVL